MGESSAMAQQRWELENAVEQISSADAYFQYNHDEQQAIHAEKPWKQDPAYYKKVKISSLALLKMAMHAKSGGNLEIMGMLQGKVQGDTFIVVDTFALPVEGTETRVNAQNEANEYMVEFQDTIKRVGRPENICGWYHSHPGYGCWLSGIDTATQMLQQKFQDPFLAIVVDPHRTLAAGKVELGAFRTYPEGYTPPDAPASEYQTIPLSKIEDFGVHCKQYYSLEVSYYKSSVDAHMLDVLWNKYWVNTLSASPLLATHSLVAGQVNDIASKLESCDAGNGGPRFGRLAGKAGTESQLQKIGRDCRRLAIEQVKGISSQVIKDLLFNNSVAPPMAAAATEVAMAPASAEPVPMET